MEKVVFGIKATCEKCLAEIIVAFDPQERVADHADYECPTCGYFQSVKININREEMN